jgi:hypothetical protein
MKNQFLVIALLGVAGCASTAVLDIGNGAYSLTVHSQRSLDSSREEAVDDANEACGKQQKHAVITSFEDIPPQAWSGYTTSVTFTCR